MTCGQSLRSASCPDCLRCWTRTALHRRTAMTSLADARNFRRVDDRLATAGQPSEAQLASAADDGVEVVINLALHDDPRYSLVDERGSVESLGMSYVHIPVQFAAPTEAELLEFCDVMDAERDRHVLVHCAANFRVTAF